VNECHAATVFGIVAECPSVPSSHSRREHQPVLESIIDLILSRARDPSTKFASRRNELAVLSRQTVIEANEGGLTRM
jgi:hypothetical protein